MSIQAENAAATKGTAFSFLGVVLSKAGDGITWLVGHQTEIGAITTALGFISVLFGIILMIPRLIRAVAAFRRIVVCFFKTGSLPPKDKDNE